MNDYECLYNTDFYAWTKLIGTYEDGDYVHEVDRLYMADEIKGIGKDIKRGVSKLLVKLIGRLLRWRYQPLYRNEAWRMYIDDLRIQILDYFDESPSLKDEISLGFDGIYKKAVIKSGMLIPNLEAKALFTLEECINMEFYPDYISDANE